MISFFKFLRLSTNINYGLSCTKCSCRFSRLATLNSLLKQTLGSLDLPSVLEPRGLYRTDGKSPDGVTMIPWVMGKQLVWDESTWEAYQCKKMKTLHAHSISLLMI